MVSVGELSSRCLSENKVSNKIMKIALKEISITDLVWCIGLIKLTLFSMEREENGEKNLQFSTDD